MTDYIIRDARPDDAPFLAKCIMAGMHFISMTSKRTFLMIRTYLSGSSSVNGGRIFSIVIDELLSEKMDIPGILHLIEKSYGLQEKENARRGVFIAGY